MAHFTFNGAWIVVYADRLATCVKLIVKDCNITSSSHRIRFPCFMWGTVGVRYCKTVLILCNLKIFHRNVCHILTYI